MNTQISRHNLAKAIRILAMDAVEAADSGHPGMPMGMADIAEVLWNDFLKHNPNNPQWINRDRFILSNGHGSMLLYALLYLSGYSLTLEDIKKFRQLDSLTPGHPEIEIPGIETTTGPLGQGLANAVGMALAEKRLATEFNRDQFNIIDHHTYVFVGDGCLMEGISHEVCSLAGTLKLGKLIVIYDDNGISIDGDTKHWFSDNTAKRFHAYDWQVITDIDGHNPEAINRAIATAKDNCNQPSLICCKTLIGWGAPNKAGTASAHGAPLGAEEVALTKARLNWEQTPFYIPKHIKTIWDAKQRGAEQEKDWQHIYDCYCQAYPELSAELSRRIAGQLPDRFHQQTEALIRSLQEQGTNVATRKASLHCLNHIAPDIPELIGGSADLTGSNLTQWQQARAITTDTVGTGNYIHYGVREFGMSAVMNGIALHGGFIPFGGTFLVFMDYAKNAVRMAALMQQRIVFIYSHDSIGLGEDGPTHQPIEHINSLRMIPGIDTWRPCDDVETAVAWQQALVTHDKPTAILLSRQTLKHQNRTPEQLAMIQRGGYIIFEPRDKIQAIIIATGSEVEIAIVTARNLAAQHINVRVVAMPCTERFAEQDSSYQAQILPPEIRCRLAIEAGSSNFWYQYVGLDGKVIGIDKFGASAKAADLFQRYKITEEHLTEQLMALVTA